MIKKFAFLAFLIVFATSAFAQTDIKVTEKKKGRPNIPGTFAIDLGFNLPTEKENFNTGIFGSRTLNLYYYYDYQIGNSKFSVHPGIGLGLERYKFNNNRTLGYIAGPNSKFDTLRMVSAYDVVGVKSINIKKTQLMTNYLDIPLEVRFSSNPDDLGRSFKASLGFKFGVLYESFTKVKYHQHGENKKFKDKQNYNLNPFRYGVTFRVGAGNFSFYGYYSLSPLFKSGDGPIKGKGPAQDITNFTVGVTLAAF